MILSHRQLRGRTTLKFLGFIAALMSIVAPFGVAWSDTNISGTILTDTTLGPTSPNFTQDTVYVVTSSLIVNAGVTLTIQPGVTLKFDSGAALNVEGTLNAQGTAAQPITLTSNQAIGTPGFWSGILFLQASSNGSTLSHCDIRFASVGALLLFSSPTLRDSSVSNCSEGVRIQHSGTNPTLTNVTVSDNQGWGVRCFDNGRATLTGCTIQNNGLSGISAFADGSEIPVIQNCTISGNNTSLQNFEGGVVVGRFATLTGNTITFNNGAGVRVGNGSDVPIIQNNTIQNNGRGISVGNNPLTNAATRITGNTIASNGSNLIEFRGGFLTANYTWVDTVQGLPVEVTGTITVNPNVTLTFNPGQQVLFGPLGQIFTNQGVVQALGTASSPIIFTASSGTTPGSWEGLSISAFNVTQSQFRYCLISYARTGIFFEGSPTVTNCTIVRCSGDGILGVLGGNPVIVNTIVAHNAGNGIVARDGAMATVSYSCAFNNTRGNFVSNVSQGAGVIEVDPLFVGANDFHLQPTSPCINAGDPAILDPDGLRSDMGVFPFLNPVVTAVNPNQGRQGETLNVTITGNNLQNGATVNFGAGITVNSTTFNSATQLTANITIASNAALGTRDVTVTNPDNRMGVLTNGFAIRALPIITSINPTSGTQNQSNVAFEVNGTNLTDATTVAFLLNGNPDPNIIVSNLTVVNDTRVTMTVAIGINAAVGDRVVTITTPGGTSNATAGANNTFTVNPVPTITSINPTSGAQDQSNIAFEVNGMNLTGATAIAFLLNGNPDPNITVSNLTVVNDMRMIATVAFGANAQIGNRVVTVTTPHGTSSATAGANNTFTINPPLTVTGVTPNQGQQGAPLDVTITGMGFQDGATVSFGAGITVSEVIIAPTAQITARLTIASDAMLGTRDVTVTNPDSSSSTLPNGFTVTATSPLTITAVAPNQGQQDRSRSDIIITGTGFQNGATVNFGVGIRIDRTTVNSATQITVDVAVLADAALGPRNVTVTNPDSQSATLPNGFTVVSITTPDFFEINPQTGTRGQTVHIKMIGVNLEGATAVKFLLNGVDDSNITVSDIGVQEGEILVATVQIGRTAALGGRVVTVTTPNGTTSSAAGPGNTFTVVALPGFAPGFVYMRSVPIHALNLDPLTVWGADAQVARYVGNLQYQFRSNGFFPLRLGEGYFVKVPDTFVPQLPPGTPAPANIPFDIPLPDNDWFIVGNPFTVPVDFDLNQWQFVIGGVATPLDRLLDGDTTNAPVTFYGWMWNPDIFDTGGYNLVCDRTVFPGSEFDSVINPLGVVSQLGVGEAMFIRTRRAGVTLRIPVPIGHPQRIGGAAPSSKRTKRQRNPNDWAFRLVTTAGGVRDTDIYLGMSHHPQGVKIEMPPVRIIQQGYVETSIIDDATRNTQYAIRNTQRWKADLRPASEQRQVWDIEVRTNQPNADVTLSCPDLSSVPRQYRVRLTDLTTGERRALRTVSRYTFRSNPTAETVRRFRIELYPASEGGLKVHNLNVNLQRGLGAHVSFVLNRPARVQMTVLSPTGKAVRTLPPVEGKAGLNALTWDGKSQAGASLTRGPYLFLLRALDDEGQQAQAVSSVMVEYWSVVVME